MWISGRNIPRSGNSKWHGAKATATWACLIAARKLIQKGMRRERVARDEVRE
jgi:hypothetical protein